jgi:hypothetical protein
MSMNMAVLMAVPSSVGMFVLVHMAVQVFVLMCMGVSLGVLMAVQVNIDFALGHTSAIRTHYSLHCFCHLQDLLKFLD